MGIRKIEVRTVVEEPVYVCDGCGVEAPPSTKYGFKPQDELLPDDWDEMTGLKRGRGDRPTYQFCPGCQKGFETVFTLFLQGARQPK